MKLYFSPGTSSLACHIILKELDIDCDLVSVNLRTKETSSQEDYSKINPKLARISFDSFSNINEYFLRLKFRDSLKKAIESEKAITRMG